ncbi:phosphate/phosphite/phosphonate ABC transporter substrate-binding protein [Planktomarina temperata]|nr:PhnD/SsuA/transferrin family substrate-binding protein [Planktomarina temperata]MDA7439714.1 phosphate/phosphite/phosphonate ABC transporter substrate-binding protein [Planktomarina temperata]
MIAHLPMYDVPANRAAHRRLWQALQDHLPDAPNFTQPSADLMVDWLSPELYLSQTCGLPYRAALHGQVQLIATPDNQIPNCPPGYYCSVLLARRGAVPNLAANDFTLAYNEPLSQSGWAAPQSIGLTGATRLQTGGHAASARAVLEGRADLAAVDALTWHFLTRDWDKAAGLEICAITPATPTLPYITALGQNAAALREALRQAILSIGLKDRQTLQIFDLVEINAEAYLQLPLPPTP